METGQPRSVARRATKRASSSASGRRPWWTWQMARRQPCSGASSASAWRSATESGPPETATSTRAPAGIGASPTTAARTAKRSVDAGSPEDGPTPRSMGGAASARGGRLPLESHPDGAVLEDLALPDGDELLQGIDGELTGLEGLAAVGRGDGDDHAGFADLEASDSMDDGHLADAGEAAVGGLTDLLQLGLRHGDVGLILDGDDASAPGVVPHHAQEHRHAARFGDGHQIDEGVGGQGLVGDAVHYRPPPLTGGKHASSSPDASARSGATYSLPMANRV